MAIRLSTGLVNAMAGSGKQHVVQASTISFTASIFTIAESGLGLGDISAGDKILISGSTSNNGKFSVSSVDGTGASIVVTETIVEEAAGQSIAIADFGGGNSFKELFRAGVLEIYSGTRPSDANNAEAGDKLLRITKNSLEFTAGSETNGLTFDDASSGQLDMPDGEIWSGLGLMDGTASYFRFYANDYSNGANADAIRFDGSCGVGAGDLRLSSTAILEGGTVTLDSVLYTFPRA